MVITCGPPRRINLKAQRPSLYTIILGQNVESLKLLLWCHTVRGCVMVLVHVVAVYFKFPYFNLLKAKGSLQPSIYVMSIPRTFPINHKNVAFQLKCRTDKQEFSGKTLVVYRVDRCATLRDIQIVNNWTFKKLFFNNCKLVENFLTARFKLHNERERQGAHSLHSARIFFVVI